MWKKISNKIKRNKTRKGERLKWNFLLKKTVMLM